MHKKKNTQGIFQRIKKHILFCTMCLCVVNTLKNTLYKDFLYYLVIGSGEDKIIIYTKETNYIYYSILALAIILFYVVFRGRKINSKSALMVGIWPGFYLFSACLNKTFLWIHLIMLFANLYFNNKIMEMNRPDTNKERIKEVLVKVYENLCSVICIMLVFGILPSWIIYNIQYKSMKSNTDYTVYEDNGEKFLENSDSILLNLSKEKYNELSQQEKLDTLQYLVDNQMSYLGVDEKITLFSDSISGQRLGGYTDYPNKKIVIDSKIMQEHREKAMFIILHESYHIYQHKCLEEIDMDKLSEETKKLRFFKDVEKWEYETKHYYSVDDKTKDEDLYDYQSLEIEADAYAERWLIVFLNFVDGE